MNPQPKIPENPEAIRSEIDSTRQRMDNTIDALSRRFRGRHLLDEVLHLFRTQKENGNMTKFKDKVSDTTGSALHTVVDTIKAHPIPAALVGAGVAWMIYEKSRSGRDDSSYDYEDDGYYAYRGTRLYEDADYAGTLPPEYSAGERTEGGTYGAVAGAASTGSGDYDAGDAGSDVKGKLGEKAGQARDAISQRTSRAKERLQEGASRLRARGHDAAGAVGDRARQMSSATRERMQSAYQQSRRRVASTVDHHPLESGFACLALGLIAGLAIPASRRVREAVGPAARDLRHRAEEAAHDMMERGKHVAEAASDAARDEAKSQGLTPDALSQKASAVADKAKAAAKETAKKEKNDATDQARAGSTKSGDGGDMPGGGKSKSASESADVFASSGQGPKKSS